MKSFFRRLRWLAERRRKEHELAEELRFHLEEEAEEQQAAGLTQDQARSAARRDLGNLTLVREATRAAWGWTILEQLSQDLRYGFRTMAANKLFSLLAIASLALGIGANTAIYSFMDSILLRALPVPDPESLVVFNWHSPYFGNGRESVMHSMSGSTWGDKQSGITSGMFPYPALELFRKNDAMFSTVFAHFQSWRIRELNVTVAGQAEVAAGWHVSGDYFRGIGLSPAAGRLIIPDDDRRGAPAVAVASFGYAQRRFGGPANAVGQPVLINNLPFVVVGVAPPEFFGVDPSANPDVYLPLHTKELLGGANERVFPPKDYIDPNYYWVQIMGRLRPGITLAQAQASFAPMFHEWVAATAKTEREKQNLPQLLLKPGAGGLDSLRRRYSKPLYVLLTLVGLILALACANVANLLLARAASRQREIALRLSVGAGRLRIARQLLTESMVLSSLGGILGVCLAIWGIRFLTLLLANGRADFTLRANLNWHVLAVACALSILTGILFGIAPALQSTRFDLMPALKETRAGLSAGHRPLLRISLRHALVVGQIAISLLMLVAAGLFVRTLSNLQSIELGFDRNNILLFQVDGRKAGHRDPEISAYYADLRQRFRAIPGIRDASLSEDSLIQAGTGLSISLPGDPPGPGERLLDVGPTFMKTMGIPILAGRDFEEQDRPGSPAAAVVNQAYAKAKFGDRNPLGRRLILWDRDRPARDMTIVGVCANARYGSLTQDFPAVVYIAYNQGYPWPNQMVFALRTSGDPLQYVKSVREIVRQADSRVPVSNVRTQVAEIDHTINQEITFAKLCTAFAVLALIIACVGLYGTVSYNVARRTSEIGVRIALGAQRRLVVRMVLSEVVVLAVCGLVIGLPVALTTSKLVGSFLYGMTPNDPLALVSAAAILFGAAVFAGYAPARRASRIEPMIALRHE